MVHASFCLLVFAAAIETISGEGIFLRRNNGERDRTLTFGEEVSMSADFSLSDDFSLLVVDLLNDMSRKSRVNMGSKSGKDDSGVQSKSGKACTHRVADQMGWSNWHREITTLAPVFRVKNDKELREIIKLSRKINKDGNTQCTVRVTGATHSEDGLVMQRGEENVVVVSLVDHAPDHLEWVPRADPDTGIVRLRAGQSWYEATALYRHHGLVLPERTAGRFFSVGGVIANPVHGGST